MMRSRRESEARVVLGKALQRLSVAQEAVADATIGELEGATKGLRNAHEACRKARTHVGSIDKSTLD